MSKISLTYSIADQSFNKSKSIGILNVSINLLNQLVKKLDYEQITIFSNTSLTDRLPNISNKVKIELHDNVTKNRLERLFWDQFRVYKKALDTGNEWLFLPKGYSSILRKCPVKLAAYVHDGLIDYLMNNYPAHISLFEGLYFKNSLIGTLRNAKIIFTLSDFTTSEVKRLAKKYEVNCPPVLTAGIGFSYNDSNVANSHGSCIERDSLLVLTSKLPYKRTDLAIDYLKRWQADSMFKKEINWVGPLPSKLEFPNFSNWKFHERLPYAAFNNLMLRSKIVLFFSEYEGFGMPPVEAVFAGACPVFSSIPATREVMGSVGFSFSNDDYYSFKNAMAQAVEANKEQIDSWREQLQERHNWDKVVARIITGMLDVDKQK